MSRAAEDENFSLSTAVLIFKPTEPFFLFILNQLLILYPTAITPEI